MRNATLVIVAAVLVVVTAASASTPEDTMIDAERDEPPKELGAIHWQRDLDAALVDADRTGSPVMLLFQEIPGCATCVNFGQGPLSHPLLVEAAEDLFIPVAIQNNRPGRDAEVLNRYDEPAWNNPVVRFVDSRGMDLIPRKDGVYDAGAIAARMLAALGAAGRQAPEYLRLVAVESADRPRAKATFAMHCFWEGEARLGAIEGVVTTRAGWLDGHEVVEVTFDPKSIFYADLVKAATEARCATRVYAHTRAQFDEAESIVGLRATMTETQAADAKDSDRKHSLYRSPLRYLPLTPMQTMKVNAALREKEDPSHWLSPRQSALLTRIRHKLQQDPDALNSLARPDSIDELSTYRETLESALSVVAEEAAPP